MSALLLLLLSAVSFSGVAWFAWSGALGLKAIGLLLVSAVSYWMARRRFEGGDLPIASSGRVIQGKTIGLVTKIAFTVVGMMALLRHPIDVGEAGALPIYSAISAYIVHVDGSIFLKWALVAMAIKFIGVMSSAFAWHLLLIGQGIRFPFLSKVLTAFLIGRFIGTFLPSTVGLDGYTLYEAGRYSNKWSRAITAKALEKFIGITGLFLGMVVTMPFGYQVIVDVTTQAGRPEAASLLAGAILAVAGGISLVVILGLVWPVGIQWAGKKFTQIVAFSLGWFKPVQGILPKIVGLLEQFTDAVVAYEGKVKLLMLALFAKFVTHFTTAVVYFFTALAIGVVGAQFWPITFGSTIQILATLLSPTIAGEGAREAFQALLLQKQLGGVAQAVLSGALGFVAAEAATLWGGLFLFTRTAKWRPRYAEVDGAQVDYAWLEGEADHRFDGAALERAKQQTSDGQ